MKEKVILQTSNPIPTWPLAAVRDTLPKGSYTAVFLGNVERTMFPITGTGGTTSYADVLTNYKTKMADGRIVLPNSEFTDTSEYYWAKVDFSNTDPKPTVLLQRIISMLNLHRNFVDAQTALTSLENNIIRELNYGNLIQTTVSGVLPGLVKTALNSVPLSSLVYAALGGVDAVVNLVMAQLTTPVVNALNDLLLKTLTEQIGKALTGNANQSGALAGLGALLNPWNTTDAGTAIVTIRNFPKTMDFGLHVIDSYTGDQRFRYNFTSGTVYDEKDILIKGFNGVFDVRKINVIKQGLVGGLLIDGVIDSSLLLNGTFIDINDPIQATVETNFRYKSDYSFIDLGLKSYTAQTDGDHSLTLTLKLSDVGNLNGLLGAIPGLSTILSGVINAIGNITISVPINLPLLGVDNLTLSGGWSPAAKY